MSEHEEQPNEKKNKSPRRQPKRKDQSPEQLSEFIDSFVQSLSDHPVLDEMEEPSVTSTSGPPPIPPPIPPTSVTMESLSSFFALNEDPTIKRHREMTETVCGGIEEFMSNFILIGYTINGDPVNVTYGKSARDFDSLNTALHKYILDNYSAQPPGKF
jgi:hypothetical protein